MPLHRRLDFGNLLRLNMLDTRQYRSDQACAPVLSETRTRGGGSTIPVNTCPELRGPDRTMLGIQHESVLQDALKRSPARWNALAQSVVVAHLDSRDDPKHGDPREEHVWSDAWSGYPAARDRIINAIRDLRVSNPFVLSGDIHSFWVNRVLNDSGDPSSIVAPEIVCSSISSRLFDAKWLARSPHNKPTVVFQDGTENGYVLCELNHKHLRANLVAALNSRQRISSSRTVLKSFVVEAGNPEPVES